MTVTLADIVRFSDARGFTYPHGYKADSRGVLGRGTRLTMSQVIATNTVKRCHPEFVRRYCYLMLLGALEGIDVGWGTGWRFQPNPPPPGFAQPGNSNHEGYPASLIPADFSINGATAVDAIPAPSWPWMNANCGRAGLKHFANVNDEAWHHQFGGTHPNSRSRRVEPYIVAIYDLPDLDPVQEDFLMALTEAQQQKIALAADREMGTTRAPKPGEDPAMTKLLDAADGAHLVWLIGDVKTEMLDAVKAVRAEVAPEVAAIRAALDELLARPTR